MKKAQSEVITTVLLVLLALIAFGIVIAFVYPYVQNQVTTSNCVYITSPSQMSVDNNPQYTCYNATSQNLSVEIQVGNLQNQVSGFIISVGLNGATNSYTINSTAVPTNVFLYGGSPIPGTDQESTYIISGINSMPSSITIYPILTSGPTCGASDKYQSIGSC